MKRELFGFDVALQLIKKGQSVSRMAWQVGEPGLFPEPFVCSEPCECGKHEGSIFYYEGNLEDYLNGLDVTEWPWECTASDLLAEDWYKVR